MRKPSKKVTKAQLYRSVASSTAIETGQSVKDIEKALKFQKAKYQHLKLALDK